MNIFKKQSALLAFCALMGTAAAYNPINFNLAQERMFKGEMWGDKSFRLGVSLEDGATSKGRNGDEDKVPVLRIYNESESSLAMLMGALPGSPLSTFANTFFAALSPATDDGFRGRFLLNGRVEQTVVNLWAAWRLPLAKRLGSIEVAAYFPFTMIEVERVEWLDQTQNILLADIEVQQQITSKIDELADTFGHLKLRDWEGSGLGDIVVEGRWTLDVKQEHREHLKNVRVMAHLGLSIPIAEVKDENHALSLPLGNDGAWGLPFGVGIALDFKKFLRWAIEVDMLNLFDETRVRRLKTDEHQTDFLLLNKGLASKSYGLTWKFQSYLHFNAGLKGLSGLLGYQFMKHDDDKLHPQTDDFSYSVVNTAESLKEWNTHSLLFQLDFDTFNYNIPVKPQFSLFYKLPFMGKRAITASTIGAQMTLTF